MAKRKTLRISRSPTTEELQQALEMARRILSNADHDWYPANTFKLMEEFERLGLETYDDQTSALRRAASEVCPADYEPPEPPGFSNEAVCRGTQMLPFVWLSSSFGTLMFFKFGLQREGYLYIFSLHAADFPKKKMGSRL
jgi:hypothetical protein